VMYLLINIAYFLVVPVDDIKSSGELVAALFFRGVFGEQVGGKLLPLAVALSAFGNVMVVTFALASIPVKDSSKRPVLTYFSLESSMRLLARDSSRSPRFCPRQNPSARRLEHSLSTMSLHFSLLHFPHHKKYTPSFWKLRGILAKSPLLLWRRV
jgi:hypothetical protein